MSQTPKTFLRTLVHYFNSIKCLLPFSNTSLDQPNLSIHPHFVFSSSRHPQILSKVTINKKLRILFKLIARYATFHISLTCLKKQQLVNPLSNHFTLNKKLVKDESSSPPSVLLVLADLIISEN